MEFPMGFHAASLEQLRRHWEAVRCDMDIEDSML
jgi:hypothetical protein